MAGDWIKMRLDLTDDPSVLSIANQTALDEFAVIGRLHRIWGWADRHTTDGVASGVDCKWLDRYVMFQGFSAAMVNVGWLKEEPNKLVFPHFERHNGESAKNRCDAALRQRESRNRRKGTTNGGDERVPIPRPFVRFVLERDKYQCVYCGEESDKETEAKKPKLSIDHIVPYSRSGKQAVENLATCCIACNQEKSDRTPEEWGMTLGFLQKGVIYKDGHIFVTEESQVSVTKTLPEKRREEKNKTIAPKARNPLFDALAQVAGGNPDALSTAENKAIGVALASIKAATPDLTVEEIQRRAANYREQWPRMTLTAMALSKHWSTLAGVRTAGLAGWEGDEWKKSL